MGLVTRSVFGEGRGGVLGGAAGGWALLSASGPSPSLPHHVAWWIVTCSNSYGSEMDSWRPDRVL